MNLLNKPEQLTITVTDKDKVVLTTVQITTSSISDAAWTFKGILSSYTHSLAGDITFNLKGERVFTKFVEQELAKIELAISRRK
jgi:hypothetical protein